MYLAFFSSRPKFQVSQFNIAAKSKDEQDKVAVDLVASYVAFKERMNMPVVPEIVVREQHEHLREFFMERMRHCRMLSAQLPNANDPRYIEMGEANVKGPRLTESVRTRKESDFFKQKGLKLLATFGYFILCTSRYIPKV